MKTSESIVEIAKAMGSFQAAVVQPQKTAENPHFKSKYVTLDSVVDIVNKLAPTYGLSYMQVPVADENGAGIITLVMHTSGEYIEFPPLILPLDRKNAQGSGSSITYARRYSLSSAFGIASDVDDDGNEASSNAPDTSNKKEKPNKVSEKQLKLINVKVNELSTLRKIDKEVVKDSIYARTQVGTLNDLTSAQASEVIQTLEGWIENAKQGK